MSTPSENETWIVDAGDSVIQKKACSADVLSPKERLVYCLWAADYGMRNAGDLDTANDLYLTFQEDATSLAYGLRLPFTSESFALTKESLQQQYFERFDRICNEIRNA